MNPRMVDSTENLQLYKLIGRIIGKAMFEQITIPVQLDNLLLKQIIKQDFALEDLLHYDKQVLPDSSHGLTFKSFTTLLAIFKTIQSETLTSLRNTLWYILPLMVLKLN